MSASGSIPTHALLPGRTRWLCVCHATPEDCNVCLSAIAGFLADEMGYDQREAMRRPVGAYQAELGEERCSWERAEDLRRMTVAACCPEGAERFYLAVESDGGRLEGAMPMPRPLKFALWWTVFLVGVGLSVL